ncbi:DNA primase [Salirhabdus salicampi]|uniref:DNA primase n=1 Tax=Salirhabdus salicampi TaxID=476102 RepID=UPI0020C5221F|nr:DNA primase [Salirhabdus salicampi]MCP8616891.1 DNA primase [Salirhabdus salicampi]
MPEQIPESFIHEIQNENDIVEVVGEYVKVKRQGRNYFGLCPFHSENSPSFSVSPEKQIFHCFGCGKGGNVITFVMEVEGVTFFDAISQLAERSNKSLPQNLRQKTEKTSLSQDAQTILEAHQWVNKLYHHILKHTKEGKNGIDYIRERGFSDDTINTFQLGFAPDGNVTASFLEKKGFHLQTMVKAGLLTQHDTKGYQDRFRGRVIFPIRNHQGKTVAFGGRIIRDSDEPKYLNSPETEIFQKSKLLFNFDIARQEIRKTGEVILFEGYMDVLAAYQAGVKNGVASLGTSLTEAQARLVRRYVDTCIICYDADNAGMEATNKAAQLLHKVGCYVKIARLPRNMDPDDYIQEYGSDKFKQHVIGGSMTYFAFRLEYMKQQYNLQVESDRIQYIEKALDEIAKIDKPVEREYYLKDFGETFQLSMEALSKEIAYRRKKFGKTKDNQSYRRHNNYRNAQPSTEKLYPAFQNAERKLIALMLRDRVIANKVQDELGGAFLINEHQILVTYLYAFYEEGHEPNVSRFMEYLPDNEIKNLTARIAMTVVSEQVSDQELHDYFATIQKEKEKKDTIHLLEQEQKEAERTNDPVRAAQIAMKIMNIKKEWKQTKHM